MPALPPFDFTSDMLNLISDTENLMKSTSPNFQLRLRKSANIRSVYSSLRIENISLSLDEVTDIIKGRRVIGYSNDIRAVKNAFRAYESIESWNSYNVEHFLTAHGIMMDKLLNKPGIFRTENVYVYHGDQIIHTGAPPDAVPFLINSLFEQVKRSNFHPLIAASLLHYGIETIHPFPDGNGRTGRLWQTVNLAQWNPLFIKIPSETLVYQKRFDYYEALESSQKNNDATRFIKFILTTIYDCFVAEKKSRDEMATFINDENEDPSGLNQSQEILPIPNPIILSKPPK